MNNRQPHKSNVQNYVMLVSHKYDFASGKLSIQTFVLTMFQNLNMRLIKIV